MRLMKKMTAVAGELGTKMCNWCAERSAARGGDRPGQARGRGKGQRETATRIPEALEHHRRIVGQAKPFSLEIGL